MVVPKQSPHFVVVPKQSPHFPQVLSPGLWCPQVLSPRAFVLSSVVPNAFFPVVAGLRLSERQPETRMTQLGGKGALRSNDRKIQNTAPKPSRRAKICDQQQTDEISGLGCTTMSTI